MTHLFMYAAALYIVHHNTKCHICIFATFQEKQKTEFLLWEWFFCFKILHRHTEYNKKWYPSMHLVFHALCNSPLWWNFSAVPAFCPNIYCFSIQIRHFVFYSFLSCWWPLMTGVLTNYSRETHLPFHSKQKCIWLNMTGYARRFGCRYSSLDHFGSCFRYGLLSLFSTLTFVFSGFW